MDSIPDSGSGGRGSNPFESTDSDEYRVKLLATLAVALAD